MRKSKGPDKDPGASTAPDQPDRPGGPREAAGAPATGPTSSTEPVREYRGTGIMWTAIAVVVAVALLVIASFQNTQDVQVEFLWLEGSLPLVLLLLIAVGTAIVLTEAIGFVWRHRRRRQLRERDELRRLRDD